MNHFHLTENLQIGRLCDIRGTPKSSIPFILITKRLVILDSLVDVVYVSPVELNDEMSQYYVKLMGMCEESQLDGQQEGKVANEEPIETRFHFVVPDNLNTFKVQHVAVIRMASVTHVFRVTTCRWRRYSCTVLLPFNGREGLLCRDIQ